MFFERGFILQIREIHRKCANLNCKRRNQIHMYFSFHKYTHILGWGNNLKIATVKLLLLMRIFPTTLSSQFWFSPFFHWRLWSDNGGRGRGIITVIVGLYDNKTDLNR